MHRPLEHEWKLRAQAPIAAESVRGILTRLAPALAPSPDESDVDYRGEETHDDLYLDDDRRSLLRAGVSLRLRVGPGGAVVCCKLRRRASGGAHVRREIEAPWPTPADAPRPPACASELPADLQHAVEPFTLERPLRPLLRIRTQRERITALRLGQPAAEIALDKVTAELGGRTASFFELEVEAIDDAIPDAAAIAAALRSELDLEPEPEDKLTHSLRLLAALPPPEAAPECLGAVVARQVREASRAMREHEALVRLDGGEADVHGLRSALRRLRSLLRAAADLWPGAAGKTAAEAAAALHRDCGPAREWDVLLNRMPQLLAELPPQLAAGAEPLQQALRARRAESLAAIRRRLLDPRRLQELAQLEAMTEHGAMTAELSARPSAAAAEWIASAARRLQRKLRVLDKQAPMPALHDARLAGKRLRFLLASFADCLPPSHGSILRKLERALDRVGAACDDDGQATAFFALLGDPEMTTTPLTAALLGALASLRHQAALRSARRGAKAMKRLDRRRIWRELIP